ncbi:4Fe-4S dicluster domain-containing protein [Vibrio cidicii]|nr:4Fe-4S dicluster domain-containing protein [Vibrio cidicii]
MRRYPSHCLPQRCPYLHINAFNCLHCKIGKIKDPTGNIKRIQVDGGGANYPN